MRFRTLLPVGLLALAIAAPASATGLAGLGQAHLAGTFCTYEATLTGLDLGQGSWLFALTLTPYFALCTVSPVHVLVGPWNPDVGGCGPGNFEYRLCLDAVPAGFSGEVLWTVCRATEPCHADGTVFAGGILAARV